MATSPWPLAPPTVLGYFAALVAEALEKNPELGGSVGHKAAHCGGFGSEGVA